MKIVYCILGTYNSGGMERVLANKANYLAAHGYAVSIITTDQQGRDSYFELNSTIELIDLGINYTENNKGSALIKVLSYPTKQRQHKKRLTAHLQTIKADVCISMFDHDVSFLHKIKDGSKKVLEIHFSRYKRLQYGRKGVLGLIDNVRSTLDMQTVKKYDRFVVLTEEDRGYWGDLSNIQVIPNANSFVPSSYSELTAKRVIAVGRYDFQKRFEDLIKVWAIVQQWVPDWKLDIFGHGPLKMNLQEAIDQAGLQNAIRLCDPVKNIEKEYVNSSILAMTSRYEGLPMALLEAQACGLPLVSYACKCGPRDIIREEQNGFLIAEGDYEGMAAKLRTLMESDLLRKKMGLKALAIAENYTVEKVMKQWMTLFEEVIQK